jgi:hypothetical protein
MVEEITELREVCRQSIRQELGEDCGTAACEDCLFERNLCEVGEVQEVCSDYDPMTLDNCE